VPGLVQYLRRDAPAVVRDDDFHEAAARDDTDLKAAAPGLMHPLTLGRSLDAVSHGVAEQVGERIMQAFQDHPIDLGASASDGQLDFLARGEREIPDRERQPAGDRLEREGSHPDRGVLEVVEHTVTGGQHIGDILRQLRLATERMSQPAPVLYHLTYDVKQVVDLLGRHPQRAAFGVRPGLRRICGASIPVGRCGADPWGAGQRGAGQRGAGRDGGRWASISCGWHFRLGSPGQWSHGRAGPRRLNRARHPRLSRPGPRLPSCARPPRLSRLGPHLPSCARLPRLSQDSFAVGDHFRADRQIADEIVHGFPRPDPGNLRAQRGGRAQQRGSESRPEDPRVAHACQNLLDGMREGTDVAKAEHPRGTLDGVSVPEKRVDELGARVPGLDREQRCLHLIEPLCRLVAEDVGQLVIELAHR
jgi:hypothetical protein